MNACLMFSTKKATVVSERDDGISMVGPDIYKDLCLWLRYGKVHHDGSSRQEHTCSKDRMVARRPKIVQVEATFW